MSTTALTYTSIDVNACLLLTKAAIINLPCPGASAWRVEAEASRGDLPTAAPGGGGSRDGRAHLRCWLQAQNRP